MVAAESRKPNPLKTFLIFNLENFWLVISLSAIILDITIDIQEVRNGKDDIKPSLVNKLSWLKYNQKFRDG